MIIKITVESDSEQDDFYYPKEVTEEEFEDIKANLEVMLDNYPDAEEEDEESSDEETEETEENTEGEEKC